MDPKTKIQNELVVVGWREWLKLPDLKVDKIKVKVDTGARTSALHVSNLEIQKRGAKEYAHFIVHPRQHSAEKTIKCKALVIDHREIRSSSGHASIRPVIKTRLTLGEYSWESEITLVNRDLMGFRMLLGREAVRNRFLVHTGRSYLQSSQKKKKVAEP